MSLLIRNGTVLTINDAWDEVQGDVWIDGDRIVGVGRSPADLRPDHTIDAAGDFVLPGFIQTHIHLCQTLFRGAADDLPLLAWLRNRIWPLEAAHDERTLASAARLAAAELQMSGTTSVLTMETVYGTEAVCEALVPTGLRAVVGKCLMDERGDAPARLCQPMQQALDESMALHQRWHGTAGGRIRTALAPRFALSCSPALLEATAALSLEHGLIVHTHASEQREEIAAVRKLSGMDNVAYLASLGLASERLCAAHCVWVTEAEQALMAERSVRVLHCPGSNLKLGSGVAPVPQMRARGISVSLGADGAACNNTLDMFHEMRLAATLQAMRVGPGALTARDAVWMATREGALAIGQSDRLGSLEPGKLADVIIVRRNALHTRPTSDPYSTLVYASRPTDVRTTIINGAVVYTNDALTWGDARQISDDADAARSVLESRVGI